MRWIYRADIGSASVLSKAELVIQRVQRVIPAKPESSSFFVPSFRRKPEFSSFLCAVIPAKAGMT